MRRKVIQLAKKTLVISLPSKWAKQHGVLKGDEIEVQEAKGRLTYSTTNILEQSRINLNISNLNSSLVWYYLTSAYIKGSDEVEIYFDNTETINPKTNKKQNTIEVISNIAEELIGLEMIKHGKNHCVLKEISKIKPEEYDNILRKIFFILKNTSQEILNALKNKDKSILQNTKYAEKNINRFTHYCLRILNKTTNIDNTHIAAHTRTIHQLEEIGDYYLKLSEELSKKQDSKTTDLIKKLNELFASFFDAYYTTTTEKIDKTYTLRAKLKKDLNNSKNKEISNIIVQISDKIMEVLSSKILIDLH